MDLLMHYLHGDKHMQSFTDPNILRSYRGAARETFNATALSPDYASLFNRNQFRLDSIDTIGKAIEAIDDSCINIHMHGALVQDIPAGCRMLYSGLLYLNENGWSDYCLPPAPAKCKLVLDRMFRPFTLRSRVLLRQPNASSPTELALCLDFRKEATPEIHATLAKTADGIRYCARGVEYILD